MNLRSSFNRPKEVSLWIWGGKFHLLSFLAVILTVLYLIGFLDYYPNVVSASMSITGLLIILRLQILDARQFAEHRPNTIRNWLMSYPRGKPIPAVFEGTGGIELGGKAEIILDISETASIKSKVDFLLRQLKNLEFSLAAVDDRVDTLHGFVKSNLKELKSELENVNSSIKSIVAGHVVGAYDVLLFAITIAICGTLIQLFCV